MLASCAKREHLGSSHLDDCLVKVYHFTRRFSPHGANPKGFWPGPRPKKQCFWSHINFKNIYIYINTNKLTLCSVLAGCSRPVSKKRGTDGPMKGPSRCSPWRHEVRMLRGEEDGPRLTRWAAPGADRVGSRDSGRYSFERSLTHNSLPPDSDSFYFFSRSLDPKLGGFCFGTDSGFLEQTNQAESFRDRWVRSSFAQRPVSERVSPKPHLTHLGYGIAWRSHFSWWTKKKTPITTKWMNRTATFEGSVPGQTGEAKLPPVRGNKHTHTQTRHIKA